MQSQDTLFRKAMALAAYDMSYKHLLNYEKLWGEEEDIELGNQALRAIEDALGTAIEESFEDWWAYSQKAHKYTSCEDAIPQIMRHAQ